MRPAIHERINALRLDDYIYVPLLFGDQRSSAEKRQEAEILAPDVKRVCDAAAEWLRLNPTT